MKRIHYAAVRNVARENIVTVQVAKLAAQQSARKPPITVKPSR